MADRQARSIETYTYRAGQRVPLAKRMDQYVVRVTPERLRALGIPDGEQMSSASTRVTTRPAELEAQMSRARAIAPTHHAYYLADSDAEFLITDRVLVTFREPPSGEVMDRFVARYGLVQTKAFSDRDFLFQLTDHSDINPVKLVVMLNESEPLVASAEHDLNQRMVTYSLALPTDPMFASEWHLHTRFVHPQVDPRSSARCEEAWQLLDSFGSREVVIGITDDGCKLDHGDFNSPGKFAAWGYLRGERLITNADIDADPGEMYRPGSNHGTSCAGVAAGEVDALLTVGGAPNCRLLPIQWQSSGPSLYISDSKLMTVLAFVADKIDVLSNSWGGVPDSRWSTQVLNRIGALSLTGGRRGKGIVFLWAAGNENCPFNHVAKVEVPYTNGWSLASDGTPTWIGVETSRQFVNNLAGLPGVVHVAALASTARRSHYSNYGPGVGFAAPTNNVHEYHRLQVSGLGITTATGMSTEVTTGFGGTSSATPLAAGVTALVISANPVLTAAEVIALLKQTASKNLDLTDYPRTPGAPYDPTPNWDVSPVAPFDAGDFTDIGDPAGTWSSWFGHGKVDAVSAVGAALAKAEGGGGGAVRLRQSSAPGLLIPDNDPAGVNDIIHIAGNGARVASVKVTVDIGHTYVGDLRVSIRSPDGSNVVLRDRRGGNARDLKQSFDVAVVPALSGLVGQAASGAWQLMVQDMAQIDTGRLNQWELEIQAEAGQVIERKEQPGVTIPDNRTTGIERTLTVTEAGALDRLEVDIDITHTYIGDLRVMLIAPSGKTVMLHNRIGGSLDNIIRTYSPVSTPELATLKGQPMHGAWRLRVVDLEAVDVGKLNRWAIRLVGA
jgi:subtilisin-like proprotein convertase family protein/subtilisin family serine protease